MDIFKPNLPFVVKITYTEIENLVLPQYSFIVQPKIQVCKKNLCPVTMATET